jgi:acyl-CoA dehydrogenase
MDPTRFGRVREEVVGKARKIAEEVSAKYAGDVDKNARFPSESIEALKKERLLSAAIPEELGGMGSTIAELSAICTALGQGCATSAMVFAMHQIQVLCILRHHQDVPFFKSYLRQVSETQRLIASATSELGVGGDTRSSLCALERGDTHFNLVKQASVISYGEHCDDILITARKHPDAPAGEQVLALIKKDQYTLDRKGSWDALGMRGTCSLGFELKARAGNDQVLPVPFADISSATMHPVSHILWTSLWLGLATSAASLARKYVRTEARKKPGVIPPNAMRAAEIVNQLHVMRAAVRDALHEYEVRYDDWDALQGLGFQIRMNNLKISASEQVVPLVAKAMSICGIAAFRNDTPYSLGRHLRDAYGAGVMILNDRLYGTNAALLLVSKED